MQNAAATEAIIRRLPGVDLREDPTKPRCLAEQPVQKVVFPPCWLAGPIDGGSANFFLITLSTLLVVVQRSASCLLVNAKCSIRIARR